MLRSRDRFCLPQCLKEDGPACLQAVVYHLLNPCLHLVDLFLDDAVFVVKRTVEHHRLTEVDAELYGQREVRQRSQDGQ